MYQQKLPHRHAVHRIKATGRAAPFWPMDEKPHHQHAVQLAEFRWSGCGDLRAERRCHIDNPAGQDHSIVLPQVCSSMVAISFRTKTHYSPHSQIYHRVVAEVLLESKWAYTGPSPFRDHGLLMVFVVPTARLVMV